MDSLDQRTLDGLAGDQTCSCCGAAELPVEAVDVVDLEVVCIDCVAAYYPAVYERRSGGSS